RSGGEPWSVRSPDRPSGAWSTECPARPRSSTTRPRVSASSSITRIRPPFIPFSYWTGGAIPTTSADTDGMARILISEPHPDLRALLEAIVRRIGHEPIGHGELTEDDAAPAVMILEPASAVDLAAAARLRRRLESLPIICTSIGP